MMSCFLHRSDTEVFANEGGRTVFLTVSRSNGLGSAVSVEWETQSDTAIASGWNTIDLFSKIYLVSAPLVPSGKSHLLLFFFNL